MTRGGSGSTLADRRLGFGLIGLGGLGVLGSSIWWLFGTHPLPLGWVLLDTASLLTVGWSTVLLLTKRRVWAIAYMVAASTVLPFAALFVSR